MKVEVTLQSITFGQDIDIKSVIESGIEYIDPDFSFYEKSLFDILTHRLDDSTIAKWT